MFIDFVSLKRPSVELKLGDFHESVNDCDSARVRDRVDVVDAVCTVDFVLVPE